MLAVPYIIVKGKDFQQDLFIHRKGAKNAKVYLFSPSQVTAP
jgi:hypothetical protein